MGDTVYNDIYSIEFDSKKPDKDIEFFWLIFKKSIIKHMSQEHVKHIELFSAKLNYHQQREEYQVIKNSISWYLNKYMPSLCKFICNSKHKIDIRRFHLNIERWMRLDCTFVMNNDIYTQLFTSLSCILKNHRDEDDNNKLIELVMNYYNNETDALSLLFDYCVYKNYSSIVFILKTEIDISKFFDIKHLKKYKSISGKKLIKIIKKSS